MSEVDPQHQMLQALGRLQQTLTSEYEVINPEIGQVLWNELQQLFELIQHRQLMFDPQERDTLVMETIIQWEGIPPATLSMITAFLELYLNVPLPSHEELILDSIEIESSIPFVRVRNINWQRLSYRGSLLCKNVVWAAVVLDQELEDPNLAERIWSARMTPCYEQETAPLGFKLFTRWDLCDTLPDVMHYLDLADMTILVFYKGVEVKKYLAHLSFMVNTYIELNPDVELLTLPEAILYYCRVVPTDVFQRLIPPLKSIVLLDEELRTIFHFGDTIQKVQSLITLAATKRMDLPSI